MTFDDHPAKREPEPHPMGLRGDEYIKYRVRLLQIEPRSRILDRDRDGIPAVQLGPDFQSPLALDGIHRFDGIENQIDDYFLQLTFVSPDGWQFGREFDGLQ